jgi:predicted nucleotidyltransferase component of viral defense system
MNIPLITRQQLEIINRKTLRYPLQIAEKDYLLTLVMQIVYQSDLQDTLVFKGGTALHHCYLEQTRWNGQPSGFRLACKTTYFSSNGR